MSAPSEPASNSKGIPKGKKQQLTLTFHSWQINAVDVMARRAGMSRAAYVNYAVYQQLKKDGWDEEEK